MESIVELTKDAVVMGFAASCVEHVARQLGVPYKTVFDALKGFYESDTCRRLHDKRTGLYLFGEKYIAEEFVRGRKVAV